MFFFSVPVFCFVSPPPFFSPPLSRLLFFFSHIFVSSLFFSSFVSVFPSRCIRMSHDETSQDPGSSNAGRTKDPTGDSNMNGILGSSQGSVSAEKRKPHEGPVHPPPNSSVTRKKRGSQSPCDDDKNTGGGDGLEDGGVGAGMAFEKSELHYEILAFADYVSLTPDEVRGVLYLFYILSQPPSIHGNGPKGMMIIRIRYFFNLIMI